MSSRNKKKVGSKNKNQRRKNRNNQRDKLQEKYSPNAKGKEWGFKMVAFSVDKEVAGRFDKFCKKHTLNKSLIITDLMDKFTKEHSNSR